MYERKVRLSGVLDELKERGEGGGEMEDTLMCKKMSHLRLIATCTCKLVNRHVVN